jgi:hypothetical protein
MPIRRVDESFYRAFEAGTVRRAPLNTALRRELREGLDAVDRLLAYRTFLNASRERKAQRGGARLSAERELLSQAGAAVRDARRFYTPLLRSLRHARYTGVVEAAVDSWMSGVERVGNVRLQEVWADAREDARLGSALVELGISERLLGEVDAEIQRVELVTRPHGNQLALDVGDDGTRVLLAPRRRATVADLIADAQFDSIIETFVGSGVFAVDVVRRRGVVVDPVDGALAGAIAGHHGLVRHRRSLADAGLAIHAGEDPLTVVLVAGAVLLAAGLLIKLACADGSGDAAVCDWADFLILLGALALTGWLCVGSGALCGLIVVSAGIGFAADSPA